MKILTIAVPAYNMEKHLPKNLPTYSDERLKESLEVIILDNASSDSTNDIASDFMEKYPEIFRLKSRATRGYGSSINEAISEAKGRFFRIVDADDWVDTEELILLIDRLKNCKADAVQTNYQTVHMQTGEIRSILFQDIEYDRLYSDFSSCRRNVPCIHSMVYRTSLLQENHITLQDNIFFVDEEYVILPFLHATSVIFYPFNIYRYLIGNPSQSTSPNNRAKYYEHRERIIRRLIDAYHKNSMNPDVREYCFFRISQAAADHLSTLYIYFKDRKKGRKLAGEWLEYVHKEDGEIYKAITKKAFLLSVLNRCHISLQTYRTMKQLLLRK